MPENQELPQTAGNTGLLMLGGLFALGAALSIRYALRHA
jgi:LPXTG-motif cell wall-anchored protein